MSPAAEQAWRRVTQIGFLALFVLAPVFDLLRYDMVEKHAYILTFPWQLGIDDLLARRIPPAQAVLNIVLRLILPLVVAIAAFIYATRRWGRIYCGWLCPHFGVVEWLNSLFIRAIGKPTLWESKTLPPIEPNGQPRIRDWRAWLPMLPIAAASGFVFTLAALTYVMPPRHVYGSLLRGTLLPGEVWLLIAGTVAFSLELLFARHLFCRYGCSVGILQSLAWMSNRRGLVVGTERSRLAECATCLDGQGSACDAVCPMRLKPRSLKRWMFSCTQCGLCIDACATVNTAQAAAPLLRWTSGDAALRNEAAFSAVDAMTPLSRKLPQNSTIRPTNPTETP